MPRAIRAILNYRGSVTSGSEPATFTAGGSSAWLIDDASLDYPAGLLFPDADAPADVGATVTLPQQVVLVRTPDELVLLDAGVGAPAGAYRHGREGGLTRGLDALGVAATDVDQVVLTHFHPGHVTGALTPDGTPRFPAARHIVTRPEYDYWTAEDVGERHDRYVVETATRVLAALESAGLLDVAAPDTSVNDVVGLIHAPGHTPGHTCVDVSDAGHRLVYVADLVADRWHADRPDRVTTFDADPVAAAAVRARLLDELLGGGGEAPVVLASHVATPLRRDRRPSTAMP